MRAFNSTMTVVSIALNIAMRAVNNTMRGATNLHVSLVLPTCVQLCTILAKHSLPTLSLTNRLFAKLFGKLCTNNFRKTLYNFGKLYKMRVIQSCTGW